VLQLPNYLTCVQRVATGEIIEELILIKLVLTKVFILLAADNNGVKMSERANLELQIALSASKQLEMALFLGLQAFTAAGAV
jgi:hypothetical protein